MMHRFLWFFSSRRKCFLWSFGKKFYLIWADFCFVLFEFPIFSQLSNSLAKLAKKPRQISRQQQSTYYLGGISPKIPKEIDFQHIDPFTPQQQEIHTLFHSLIIIFVSWLSGNRPELPPPPTTHITHPFPPHTIKYWNTLCL